MLLCMYTHTDVLTYANTCTPTCMHTDVCVQMLCVNGLSTVHVCMGTYIIRTYLRTYMHNVMYRGIHTCTCKLREAESERASDRASQSVTLSCSERVKV